LKPASLITYLLQIIAIVVIVIVGILLYDAFGKALHPWKWHGLMKLKQDTPVYHRADEIDSSGIHIATGLMYGPGFSSVRRHCLACHSAQMITQNRATREGWQQSLRWMQQTQGLWDLGADEPVILDYLAKYYAPATQCRRVHLHIAETDWYELKPDQEQSLR
jgi:hypothetical protein